MLPDITNSAQGVNASPPACWLDTGPAGCYFLSRNLNLCGLTDLIGLLRSRRPSFSSGISKRSEGKNSYRLSDARQRHGFTPGASRAFKSAHQRAHRAFQDAQERQSFAARTVEDGFATPKYA